MRPNALIRGPLGVEELSESGSEFAKRLQYGMIIDQGPYPKTFTKFWSD